MRRIDGFRPLAVAALVAASCALPAGAQDIALTNRVGTLEKQMKAVQRKVFPGGDPRYFTPDIAPETSAPAAPDRPPATSALTDLTTRVDALERQQRTLTGAVEEAQNRLRLLDEAFAKYRGDTDFRLNALEHPVSAAPPPAEAAPAPLSTDKPSRKPAKVAAEPPPPAKLSPDEQYRAANTAYGAKEYDKAASGFADFVAASPKAPRASSAQYLLGRSLMAQDRFAESAKAFLDGYKNYPDGDRAADSLLWLGKSLTALKKLKQACSALDELKSVYGARLGPVQTRAAATARAEAKCDG